MITNVIKSQQYKTYRLVTFIKDFLTLVGGAGMIGLAIYLIGSFYIWDWLNVSKSYLWQVYRVTLLLAAMVSLYTNKDSHADELNKMATKDK